LARRSTRIVARDGDGEVPFGGSCSPPLPTLRPHPDNDDDDAPSLPLTSRNYAEVTVFKLAALFVA
jgi:hypothetical protein